MQKHIQKFPLFLILFTASSLLMMLPAMHALAIEDHSVAQSFFYTGALGVIIAGIIGLAMAGQTKADHSDLQGLMALLAAYILLPLFFAVPFYDTVQSTAFVNVYLEMVSSFTTTGLPIFEPDRLEPTLHLWRALVAWAGGLLIWVSAVAIFSPLDLGGFEVSASITMDRTVGHSGHLKRAMSTQRMLSYTAKLAPLYFGLTVLLALFLAVSGVGSLEAAILAMSTMATSGIMTAQSITEMNVGFLAEVLIFGFFVFAISRLTFDKTALTLKRPELLRDPEIRSAIFLCIGIPLFLFFRHWLGAIEFEDQENIGQALRSLWGATFTVLSFVTTTGFISADWGTAQAWSGLTTPGMILMALALIGGGVATTAGGVKLLRVYALYLNGKREMERLVHPSSIGGMSAGHRQLRRFGAFIAWIFFMLFALSLALVAGLLALSGMGFENALVMAVATLSTTGPLVTVSTDAISRLLELTHIEKFILCAAMILGRMETLAIIALFNPDFWRR